MLQDVEKMRLPALHFSHGFFQWDNWELRGRPASCLRGRTSRCCLVQGSGLMGGHVGPGDVPQTLGQWQGPKGPKFHAQGKVLWMS